MKIRRFFGAILLVLIVLTFLLTISEYKPTAGDESSWILFFLTLGWLVSSVAVKINMVQEKRMQFINLLAVILFSATIIGTRLITGVSDGQNDFSLGLNILGNISVYSFFFADFLDAINTHWPFF